MDISRRNFLKVSSLVAAGAALEFSPFGLISRAVRAAPSASYQALICIFMAGGNDSNNTLIANGSDPVTGNSYRGYASVRGNIAIPQASLAPLTTGSAQAQAYALHPSLKDMAALYNSGNLAVVTNVGPLVQPTTVTDYKSKSAPLPGSLFSHRDQQIEWQNSAASSSGSAAGWGGLLADAVKSMNGTVWPTLTSFSGLTVFCNGDVTTPAALGPSGGTPNTALRCGEGSTVCSARGAGLQALLGTSLTEAQQLDLVSANSVIGNLALSENAALAVALRSAATISTPLPANPNKQGGTNSLATALRNVAQMMSVARQLNIARQIFFVQTPGLFDTHSAQTLALGSFGSQDQALQIMNDGLNYFHTVLTADATFPTGFWPNTTLFTMSDFSRTFQSNTAAGTDHAWGSHHFVLGGSVQGGKFYGTMPTLQLNGPDDADGQGRWVPTTSVSQYGATLAQWFGVTDPGALNGIFPTLKNFGTSNLGFV